MTSNIARRLLFQKFFKPLYGFKAGQSPDLPSRAERRKAARAFAAGAWRASCAQAKLEE